MVEKVIVMLTFKLTLNHNSSCTPTCNSKYELSGGDNKQYKCSLGDLTDKKMIKNYNVSLLFALNQKALVVI